MLDNKEKVISTLRACLMSTKGGMPIFAVQRDFKSLVGEAIPYQNFGYQSLEQFIKNVPGIKIYNGSNGLIVEAVPLESSAHITNMISKQKSSGPKRSSKPFAPSRKPYGQTSWKPPPSSNRHYSQRPQNLSITLRSSNPNRKVTLGYEFPPSIRPSFVPPRLQKHAKPQSRNDDIPILNETENLRKQMQSRLSLQDVPSDKTLQEYGYSTNKTITSPFAPSAAIAAGRAKTEAEAVMDLKKDFDKVISPYDAVSSLVTNEFEDQAEAVMDLKKIYASLSQPLNLDIQEHAPMPQHGYGRGRIIDPHMVGPARASKTVYEYCEKLKVYSLKKGWPDPIYKITPRYPKNQRTLYGCQVKIGDGQQYSCYPDESVVPEEAREFAAKKAYTHLMQLDSVEDSTYKVTDNMRLMCDRIIQMISNHPNGLWSHKVIEDYQKLYKEKLPSDWSSFISTSPFVSIGNRFGEDKFIIFPNTPAPEMATPADEPFYVSELPLPEENLWSVYVTCVNSTTEVWVRLVGEDYSDEYGNLLTDMELYYLNVSALESVKCPEVGAYYAVPFEDSWCRVCVQEIGEDKACCWLIDHGEYDEFPFEKIYKLHQRFYNLARQAVQCQLAGLEDYEDEKIACDLMIELLVGKCFVANVQSRDNNSSVVTVVMYDTSTDDDVNINETLINMIFTQLSQPLLHEGDVKEVSVSNITDKGEIYLKVKEETFNHLSRLLGGLDSAMIEASKVLSFKNIVTNKLYLVKYGEAKTWQRGLVTQPPSQQHNKIEVFYVDYGITDTVTISDIANLGIISELMEKIPYQAIQIQLKDVPLSTMTPAKVIRLNELLMNKEYVLVKVIKPGEVPIVDLYIRLEPNNVLVSINDNIALDPALNKTQVIQKPLKRPDLKLPTDLGSGDFLPVRGLPPPVIPTSSVEYFDITVTMVASPSNFTVRPFSYEMQFKNLEGLMQDYYNQENLSLRDDEIIEEEMYATMDKNGQWCRCRVLSKLPSRVVTVYNSDYGHISVVSFTNLRALHQKFRQFPYLAIKAKLHGIVPSHSDWSVEDCLRCKELLFQKTVIALIKERGTDSLNSNDPVLGLSIVDTSTNIDINIATLLVKEGRAIYTMH